MPGIAGMGRPQQIKSPIPQDAEVDAVAQQGQQEVTQLPQGQQQAATAEPSLDDLANQFMQQQSQPSEPSLDDLANQFMSQQEQSGPWRDLAAATPEQEAEAQQQDVASGGEFGGFPTMGFQNLGQQLSEAPTRAKLSFAVTDKEKRNVLEERYGAGNVKKAKGGFLVKRDSKWTKFDSDNFEIIGDFLDWTRESTEGAVQAGATTGGLALAGVESTTGVGALAAPSTVAAAYAMGGYTGKKFADYVAQNVLGIPRDPERSMVLEDTISAAVPMVASKMEGYFARKALERETQAGTRALVDKSSQAYQAAKEVEESVTTLKQAGQEVGLLPSIAEPTLSMDQTKEMAKHKPVKEAFLKIGKQVNDAFTDIADAFSNFSGKKVGTGDKFLDVVDDIQKAEGKLIGEFRQQAIDTAGDTPVAMPKTANALKSFLDEIGMIRNPKNPAKLVIPTEKSLIDRGYSREGVQAIMDRLPRIQGLAEEMYNGGDKLSMQRINGMWESFGKFTNKLMQDKNLGYEERGMFLKLKNALRDDFVEGIGSNLDDTTAAREAYKGLLSRYSQIKGASETLSNLLGKESISSEALGSYLFNKGAGSLERIKAAKAIIQSEKPGLWDDIVGQHLYGIFKKHTSDVSSTNPIATNWSAVRKEVEGLGNDVLSEMVPEANRKAFDAVLRYGDRVFQRTPNLDNVAPGMLGQVFSGLYELGKSGSGTKLLMAFDSKRQVAKYLAQNGPAKILETVPQKQRPALEKILNEYSSTLSGIAKKYSPVLQTERMVAPTQEPSSDFSR